jgi:hypothetical protein
MKRFVLCCGLLSFALSAGLFGLGCSADGRPSMPVCTAGEEGCACASAGRCLTGLVCEDGRCVDPTAPRDAGTGPARDGGGTTPPPVTPNPDAFWADDPPPMYCGPDGMMGPPPIPPGGTPECPDDKNREGCRCDPIGSMGACWPGLRVNRNRGICRDGMTRCEPYDEFTGVWGPCVGAVLPMEGVRLGPGSCSCFSQGRWEIDNLSPCFISYGSGPRHAVSTYIDGDSAACPSDPGGPPPSPQPGTVFSTNRLTVDCEGQFRLCYTLKAGDAAAPSAADCVVAETCTEAWYETRGVTQELPPLPAWAGTDATCAERFASTGGYGEMSVTGLSVECDAVDDGMGGSYIFNRVNYCPLSCNETPTAPECVDCMMGGSGMF